MFFTFGNEAKARKALQYAEERLSEAQAMAAKNRVKEMERAANDYEGFMAMVNERLEVAAEQGLSDNISERVALATTKHLAVLDKLIDRAPEQAREAILRARIASSNGQEDALWALAKNKPERVIDIAAGIIENRLERARVRATENATADVAEAISYIDRLSEIEDEIVLIAEETGIDITAIRQRLAQATANRLDILSGVYEKVPENARQAIANAIENSVRKYERALEKLREKNALGDVPDEDTILNRIQAEVRERLGIITVNEAQDSDNITVDVRINTENPEKKQQQTENQTQTRSS
jgi:ribosomal protein L19E